MKRQSAKPKKLPFVAGVLDDGTIVETLYRPTNQKTVFCLFDGQRCSETDEFQIGGETYIPYAASNNLLKNQVVLFPSEPSDYGDKGKLLESIRAFIHRHVDLSPGFEDIAVQYVLFTWVHDAFQELCYLKVRGDYGSGKSRFLLAVGSLCYRPIFASGASTASPLFRMLDSFRGTLIVDESDFSSTDEKADITKILNNGNGRGFPVLRSEPNSQGEFNPRSYQVFGPKIVATRGYFDDPALESRFLTEDLGLREVRADIPVNLPSTFHEEARQLRNQLLLFRFHHLHQTRIAPDLADRSLESRLNQIFIPLLSTVEDPRVREAIVQHGRTWQAEMAQERGAELEARVLEIVRDLIASGEPQISVQAITRWLGDRHGEDYERRLTPKAIGQVLRRKFRLQPVKRSGIYVLPVSEFPKLPRLYRKFNVDVPERDIGDVVDLAQGGRVTESAE